MVVSGATLCYGAWRNGGIAALVSSEGVGVSERGIHHSQVSGAWEQGARRALRVYVLWGAWKTRH